jgi:hypothetical protein
LLIFAGRATLVAQERAPWRRPGSRTIEHFQRFPESSPGALQLYD